MYLSKLSASDYGNAFYAAAAQAGSQSWSAWFFGSLDAGDFITVDKPPASLWVTGLAVRVFGMNGWAVLAPQAVMGVAAVAVLVATVRRVVPDPGQGAAAGLIAGAVLACTPAAALMFRFNNPDALLVLLLVVAAYCLARAVQVASWQWLALVGVAMGTAFLTKMLQGFLVLPGFGLAYLLAAPTTWRNRLLHLAAAAGALVIAAGWWILVVQLTPASSRPYIGGSTDNTVLDLAFDYNGLGRLVGHESDWGGATIGSMNTATGLHRLFTTEMANEISWVLPVALFATVFGCYLAVRGRLDRNEWAALMSWGGWLLVTGLVFSFMHGTIHPYYTVALAPAVAALVGLSGVWAWRLRAAWDGRLALVCLLSLGGWWSSVLLRHNHFGPSWMPAALVLTCAAAAASILVGRRLLMSAGLVAGTAAAVAGTVAFSIATVATPHHGAIPNAVSVTRQAPGPAEGTVGGWTGDEATNPDLAAMLAATTTRWSAATNGSQSAAALELATRTSVMAIGGWSGDPTPTLAQFIDDVHFRRVAYYVEAGRGGAARPQGRVIRSETHSASHSREIADWVAEHYPALTVGTSLVYRLI
jgi:YD repeat-containing protein